MIEIEHTRQPQHATEINARWRGRGFVWADLPALGGGDRTYNGVSLGRGRLGGAAQIPNASSSRLLVPAPPSVFDFSGDGTAVFLYERTSGHNSYPTPWARVHNAFGTATAGRGGFALFNATGNLYTFYRNAADTAWMETSAHTCALNTPHVWVARKHGLNLSIWRDGLSLQQVTATAHGPTPPSNTRVIYGVHDGFTVQPAGLIYLSAWSGAALSDGEIFNLSRNPWQLFAPHRTYFLPAGVPGGSDTKTITDAATGADALASIAVGLSVAEAGSGNDALPGPHAAAAVGDAGTGIDAVPALAAALGLADTGTGNDAAPTLAAALGLPMRRRQRACRGALLGLADTATGADIIAALAAALGVADSGGGADGLSVLTATLLTVTDAASGADVIAALAAVAGVTDTGAGVDSITVSRSSSGSRTPVPVRTAPRSPRCSRSSTRRRRRAVVCCRRPSRPSPTAARQPTVSRSPRPCSSPTPPPVRTPSAPSRRCSRSLTVPPVSTPSHGSTQPSAWSR